MSNFTCVSSESVLGFIRVRALIAAFAFFVCVLAGIRVEAQTTEFVYQGQLQSSSAPASGPFDFEFLLFDALTGGSQIGSMLTRNSVAVATGIFSVPLDFGSNYPGANRFLEIHVRPTGAGSFTPLTPRQSVSSAPYSVKSLSADNATNAANATNATNATNAANATNAVNASNATTANGLSASCFGCVTNAQIGSVDGAKVTGTVANAASAFNATNFSGNLAGEVTGTQSATVVTTVGGQSAANVGGAVQSVNAATSNNTANTLVKRDASGNFITGAITGNLTGNASTATTATNATNAAIATNATQLGGVAANQYVLTGDPRMTDARNPLPNSANYIQNQNAAPQASTNFNVSGTGTAGIFNAATQFNLGGNRILSNAGNSNLFAGVSAGQANSTGSANSFFGSNAGYSNAAGNDFNSYFGANAGLYTTGIQNSYFGANMSMAASSGSFNSFFGFGAGVGTTSGEGNTFIGRNAGQTNSSGNSNTIVGVGADVGSGNLNNATAIGAGTVVTASNRVQIGRIGLDTTAIGVFGPAGPSLPVCINTSGAAPNVLISCSASSLRYKDDVRPLRQGLSLIQRLRPVTFNWKEGHTPDLGLIAEEVAAIEPLLTTHNTKGEIEGVKYERLNVVLINAVKEQQAQIEAQQKQIDKQNALNKKQQAELDALKALVCSHHRNAAVCKPKN